MSVITLDVERSARRSRRGARSRAWQDGRRRAELESVRRDVLEEIVSDYWGESATSTELPKPHHELYERCLAGHEVAEALPTKLRELLVAELCTARWTDQQIADHTRMTLYTTARIRARLGLSPSGEAGT